MSTDVTLSTAGLLPAPLATAGQVALQLDGVGKEYRLYDNPRQRLRALLTGRAYHRSHWALQDVSFALHRGQCLGVIGDNGAGKSSLLKLLAGTMAPTTGTLQRIGRVTAILELGAGFHPDFTGRDNLYFAGSLIGIGQQEMARLEASIIEFSELGEAVDRAVKTYSSGMVVRLAFALVTAVQPDVLIIDEALAVGDQHFQKKCVERITAFRKAGCTILFCSHSPYHIRNLCDVALWLDGGRVQRFGDTESVLGAYEVHTRLRNAASHLAPDEPASVAIDMIAGRAALESATGQNDSEMPVAHAVHSEGGARIVSLAIAGLDDPASDMPTLLSRDLVATITVRGNGSERPNVGFMIEQAKGSGITSLATHEEGAAPRPVNGNGSDGLWQSVLTFPDLPLHSGDYVVSAFLFDATGLVVYDEWLRLRHFRFVSPTLMPGLVRLPHRWE